MGDGISHDPLAAFVRKATKHLDQALAGDDRATRAWQAAGLARQSQELVWSLRAVIDVMARYLADVNAPFEVLFDRWPGRLPPWARAGFAAHAALGQAAAALLDEVQLGHGRPGGAPASGVAGQIQAAAAAMRCGRDLLHTHFGLTPEGSRLDRSEWAPAIASNPVTRAVMLEVGLWARQTAQIGATAALTARGHLNAEHVRRNVSAASQWLWAASAAIHSARQQVPGPAADVALLHAIPVNLSHRPDDGSAGPVHGLAPQFPELQGQGSAGPGGRRGPDNQDQVILRLPGSETEVEGGIVALHLLSPRD